MNPTEEQQNVRPIRGTGYPKSNIWAIGGGKGGVGKTFVSTSLAVFLSNLGYKTTIVDLDLGAANTHTSLGEAAPRMGIQNLIMTPNTKLVDVAQPTKFTHLNIVSGSNDALDVADINNEHKSRLMSAIYNHEADFTILDLSAGTHKSTLDFFLMAQKRLLIFTPEPSSIENAYRFMKSSFFRNVKRFEHQLHLKPLIDNLMQNKSSLGIKSPADLLALVIKNDPVNGERLKDLLNRYDYQIILNQTRTFKDMEIGESIAGVSKKYFGLNTSFLGHVDHDNAVWQSLRKRQHLLVEYPHSRLYTQLMKITRKLVQQNKSLKLTA
ncbi:MAG: P-loop NTPase [Bdellovibrionales bacterium]|nr:P-loop NTPase [Bdellovibrionales bacterium]